MLYISFLMKPGYLILLISLLTYVECQSQLFLFNSNKRTDTSRWFIRNKSGGIIPGNCTYFGAAVNFARNREPELSIGRANVILTEYGRGMTRGAITSWGFTYAFTKIAGQDQHTGKFFLEYINIPPLLFGNFVLRTDYSVNFTNKQHYFRPSLGITLKYADLLYSYSLKTAGPGINQYRHGFTIRAKLFAGLKNLERDYFIKNRPWLKKQLELQYSQK